MMKRTQLWNNQTGKCQLNSIGKNSFIIDKNTATFDKNSTLFYQRFGKRTLDITLILIGIPFVLPILILIAVLIKLEGGKVLFHQQRLGRNGRKFRFWKFRSMVADAEGQLGDYLDSNPAAAKEWHISQKLKHDPRITRIGHFIRKTSLDELPQLWNVLIGDMSLVGPRPMMPEQRSLYPGNHYELMRPGITGFWQVSDRNQVSFSERAIYDANYAQNISLATDIKTLFQTINAVCKGSGC